jgi:hypothetical protein
VVLCRAGLYGLIIALILTQVPRGSCPTTGN